jgi:hypothetical protein
LDVRLKIAAEGVEIKAPPSNAANMSIDLRASNAGGNAEIGVVSG